MMHSPQQAEILTRLEQVVADERLALMHRDWDALERLTLLKGRLVDELSSCIEGDRSAAPEAAQDQLIRLKRGVQHNAALAKNLSEGISSFGKKTVNQGIYTRSDKLSFEVIQTVQESEEIQINQPFNHPGGLPPSINCKEY